MSLVVYFDFLIPQIRPTCLQAQAQAQAQAEAQAKAQSQVLPQDFTHRSGNRGRGEGGGAVVPFTVLSAEGKGPSKKDAKHFASKQLLCKLFPSAVTPEEALGAATSAKEQYTMRKRAKRQQERPERGRLGIDAHGAPSAGTGAASAGGVSGSKKRPRQDRNADARAADGGNSEGNDREGRDDDSCVSEREGWRMERTRPTEKQNNGEGEGVCEGGGSGGGGEGGGMTRQEQRQADTASSSQRKRVLPSDIEEMAEQLRSSTRLHAAEDAESASPSTTVDAVTRVEATTTAVRGSTAPGKSSEEALSGVDAAVDDAGNSTIEDTAIANTRIRKRGASDLGISDTPEVGSLTDQLNGIGKIRLHELEES